MKKDNSYDEQFIMKILEKYQVAKYHIEHKNDCLHEATVDYGNITKLNFEKEANYIKVIETILALMPKPEYTFLIKNYLNQNDRYWWKQYYSKTEYKKLKRKALNCFLYLYLI